MERLESEEDWDEAYVKSKPLISYSILVGISMDKISKLIMHIVSKGNLDDYQIEPEILSRMPQNDRHDYEFPEGIQDFVFYDKFKISKDKMGLEFVPLVLTSTDSRRKFAMACKFYENIKNYIIVLKKHFDSEEERKQDTTEASENEPEESETFQTN